MAASGSSGSSFASSSLAISAVSALTSESSAPQTPLRPLDLGPPGFNATIKLFERTPNESTIYLGPWEIVGSDPRRVVWQCSYQGEVLEHFLPSDVPAEIFPYTLHAQHRRFGDPREMELYVSFKEPHRVRYTTPDGVVHDEYIEVRYDFTTIEGSIQFQGDLRRRDLVDWFDADVIWSDTHGRQDTYGNVRGLGTIQRVKLWRDRYSTFHYITFFANHRRRFKEYLVHDFDGELRGRDERHRRLRLNVRTSRRGSAPDNHASRDRRFSASSIFRPRQQSVGHRGDGASSSSSTSSVYPTIDIRYLGIQFTRNERLQVDGRPNSDPHYRRFADRWVAAHSSDDEFGGVPFPPNHIELPSPQIPAGQMNELPSPESYRGLASVPEPPDSADDTP